MLLEWFKKYLSDRYQQVVISGQKSEVGIIKAQVPQGYVLGPLPFLIYINDICNITECSIKLFTDYTSLFIEFDIPDAATKSLNEDLASIQDWADQRPVKFSIAETTFTMGRFKKKAATAIRFNI